MLTLSVVPEPKVLQKVVLPDRQHPTRLLLRAASKRSEGRLSIDLIGPTIF